MSSNIQYITVPWVPLADFDWSFARSGPLPWNQTVWSILAVFTALPIWMTFELTIWIFYIFRRYTGLYFYSVLTCTWGTTIHAIGFVLKFCVPQCNWILSTILAEIGWVSMVTGFSVVLYSRLNLIVGGANKRKVMNLVLAMIIVDALLFHVPTIVFQFGVSSAPTHEKFLPYMEPMERVQIMGFSIQETIISAIYIYYTIKWLQGSFDKNSRKTIALLIWIQVIVILCDVIVITLDYLEYFTLKAVVHSHVYAFKLQLEFVILNEIKAMAQKGRLAMSGSRQVHSDQVSGLASPQTNIDKSGGKGWWSSTRTLLARKDSNEKNVATSNVLGTSTSESGHPGDINSLNSRDSRKASDPVIEIRSQTNKQNYTNTEFITSQLNTASPAVHRDIDDDLERQYIGRWSNQR